jgi:hypothetical protein
MGVIVTDVLGREREARMFEDGSYDCPFCGAGVQVGSKEHALSKCPNPACFAHPNYPLEVAKQKLAEQEQREHEEARREEIERWRTKYAAERAQAAAEHEAAVVEEARQRGACVACALKSIRYGGKSKFTKHRKSCPLGDAGDAGDTGDIGDTGDADFAAYQPMTYGTLPPPVAIRLAMEEGGIERGYRYKMGRSDREMAARVGVPSEGTFDAHELYEILEKLTIAWEQGEDLAGDFASGILDTLGFEWI